MRPATLPGGGGAGWCDGAAAALGGVSGQGSETAHPSCPVYQGAAVVGDGVAAFARYRKV